MGSRHLTAAEPEGSLDRSVGESWRFAPIDRVCSMLFGPDGPMGFRMVAICSEPGMDERVIVTDVLSHAARLGSRVTRRDFSGCTPETASRSLARLARKLSSSEELYVVAIEQIPPSDEVFVAKQARALKRMWDSGASILFTLLPEAGQLVEALPECVRVGASSLLLRCLREGQGEGVDHGMLRLTRGIPSLVRAFDDVPASSTLGTPPEAYYDSLGDLLEQSLRPTLSDEERRTRLCMLLLGHGRIDELREVLGQVHTDLLEFIRENAPLFGLSTDLSVFSCLSSVAPGALAACLRHVTSASALFPEVAIACLTLLIARGELTRASALASLPECEDALSEVVSHAAEFIDVGEVGLVRHALEREDVPADSGLRVLRSLVGALDTRGVRGLLARGKAELPSGSTSLLVDARQALWGRLPGTRMDATPEGELERRLMTHAGFCALLMRGAFSASMSLLAGIPSENHEPCLSNALLAIDREVTRHFVGCAPSGRGDEAQRAVEFLTHRPLRGLSGYVHLLEIVEALLDDRVEPSELEAAASRLERSGDALVQVLALIAGAIADLRRGASARALVRATLAVTASERFDADYLCRVSHLLVDVSGSLAGNRLPPRVLGAERDDLSEVSALVWETLLSEDDPMLASPLREEAPRDALWLLRVLCTGLGDLSSGLVERMPQSWRKAASATGGSWPPQARPHAARVRSSSPRRSRKPVKITLLGGFSLSVRGQDVPEWKLERRSVKPMLEYLVLRGGGVKRFQVVEQIWPDCDYVQGFNRAYQTTSALRSLIGDAGDDRLNLIVANRMSGEIAVDMSIVDCDVTEFREMAREAVDSEDAVRSLECARAAERLYGGDLYVPPSDATGFIEATRMELRGLYADAMVEGSAAALALGHDRTAVRLAENAVTMDNMRKDAVTALVRALKACGRDAEASRQRRAFEDRTV